jgi:hypothetical protein
MSLEMPTREEKSERSEIAQPEQEGPAVCEEQGKPRTGDEPASKGFRFDDPYWDDAFDSWHNPTLRTCCRWC